MRSFFARLRAWWRGNLDPALDREAEKLAEELDVKRSEQLFTNSVSDHYTPGL